MSFTQDTTLRGQHASLVPLTAAHHDDLVEAVRDGELWKLWYTAIPTPEGLAAEIDRRLGLQKAGSMLPFAVLNASGQAVGMTTYMNIDAANRRVEIGSTWYRTAVQRSPLNTECKRLLLTHAFEALDCEGLARVDFFVRPDGVLVNEVNTMPGFTPISLFPRMCAASGIDYATVLDLLIADALRRGTGLR